MLCLAQLQTSKAIKMHAHRKFMQLIQDCFNNKKKFYLLELSPKLYRLPYCSYTAHLYWPLIGKLSPPSLSLVLACYCFLRDVNFAACSAQHDLLLNFCSFWTWLLPKTCAEIFISMEHFHSLSIEYELSIIFNGNGRKHVC